VLDEIAYANTHGVAVIGVCWPANVLSAAGGPLANDQCVQLATPPAATGKLSDADLETVLVAIFERRALGIKTRLDQLVSLAKFFGQNESVTLRPRDKLGDLDTTGPSRFVRVFPHRPTNDDLHGAVRAGRAIGARVGVSCCYCESDPNHALVRSTRWLFEDGHQPACSLWAYTGTVP
jgi:hypothetical protein